MKYMRDVAWSGVVHMTNDRGTAVCGLHVARHIYSEPTPKRVDCQGCLAVLEQAVAERGLVPATTSV